MPNAYSGIVAAIKAKMDLEDISQAELARISGVHHGVISRLLRGKRKPRATTLAPLLDSLGLKIDGFQG